MITLRTCCSLWLLLLLCASGSSTKWNLFKRNPQPREGDVRLAGSASVSEGRVEVYHEGKWGTVCDDGWDIAEAMVVCRQLHFPRASRVVVGNDYGKATGPIWLDDLECKGTEKYLTNCEFKNWGVTDCSHKEDVGVVCETESNVTAADSRHLLDHSISLTEELGQIFDSKIGCDFHIMVQSETGSKQDDGVPETTETEICAHKMILSQFPLFNASEETTGIMVSVSQFCQPHFTSFIRYFYTRRMELNFSSAQCLHQMASTFRVKQLMEDIGRLFTKILPEDASFHTQVSLHEYARETEDLVMQENCAQYLAWNYQNLSESAAWPSVPVELLEGLLRRSDLVVPDEYFVLQTVQSWITATGNLTNTKTQADLLNLIRFPMIPAEKLYDLESNFSLYSTHKSLFKESMLKAFQFNVLLFSKLQSSPGFNKDDDDYKARIYTAQPWSIVMSPSRRQQVNPVRYPSPSYNRRHNGYNYYQVYPTPSPYGNSQSLSFSTPVHNSLIFKDNKYTWQANINLNPAPVARLTQQYSSNQYRSIVFRNQLLMRCQDKFICHVQDFKVNGAELTVNGSYSLSYPCPEDKYIYRFVVRPEYQ